ncbi:hypothetical protein N7470_003747 [Penicillium chermesinum]|nr:hypothetical protein N7470_003747 [Penicillium chermesinum]
MGNGAKANQKRERNAKQTKTGPTSQIKSNQKAMSIMCQVCRQTFLQTTKAPAYVTSLIARAPTGAQRLLTAELWRQIVSPSTPPTSIIKAWATASLA